MRRRGVAKTLELAGRWVLVDIRRRATPKFWISRAREWWFDYSLGVDTSRTYLAEVDVDEELAEHATNCSHLGVQDFQMVMSAVPARGTDYTFVDFGSGKGRVLFYAAQMGFKNIIGVEFVRALHEIAERNIENYMRRRGNGESIRVFNMDAAEYELPLQPTIVFMANPFGDPVMERMLVRLERSLRARPRELYVAYYLPKCAPLLDASGFLEPIRSGENWRVYRSTIA